MSSAASKLYTPLSIEGQTALITGAGSTAFENRAIASIFVGAGASSGIGEACALRFAEAKCRLILIARRMERLESLKAKLEGEYKVKQAIPLETPVMHALMACRWLQVKVHVISMDVRNIQELITLPEILPPEFQKVQTASKQHA
jgi:NADP-dependent 3-hydroxy acid dehydrogenase YdfG